MGRSNTKTDVFKNIKMGAPDECWPWKAGTGGGTAKGKPRPYFNVDGRKYIAYRLVWELVHGVELTADVFLCHSCNNSVCCNPNHLREDDHQGNMDDMVRDDRHGLSHATVRRIRVMLMQGISTHQEIADLNETSRATVGRIHRGELHTHELDYVDKAET